MAEQKISGLALTWGRVPDGRFAITLAIPIAGPGGKVLQAPFTAFILTPEEEQSLRAAMGGLHVVSNGHLLKGKE
jgi:hypothetical protein